jgi:hypothetical protein
VVALADFVEVDEVGVGLFGPTPRRLIELSREEAHGSRNRDALDVEEAELVLIKLISRAPRCTTVAITDEASPFALTLDPIDPRKAMRQGCVAGADEGGKRSGGVVADVAKLSVGREECYTRDLATDHE